MVHAGHIQIFSPEALCKYIVQNDDDFLFNCPSMSVQSVSVCLFCCFTSQVNSYDHGGKVSSHDFLGKLEQAVNKYFVHIV